MAKKRTYSAHDKRRAEQQDMARKRNSAQQRYKGPVSFPEHDEDSASDPKSTGRLSVFDKVLSGKLKPVKNKPRNIYGSREDFEDAMNDQSTKKSNGRAVRSYLPTPPSEVQKQQIQHANRFFPALKGAAASLVTQVTRPAWKPAARSTTVENTPEPDEPKEPYIPREYQARKSFPPQINVLGGCLSHESHEAELWSINQQESPFFKLPAEIRNQIYEETLPDGDTVLIDYETYRSTDKEVLPVFKYRCQVFSPSTDPFQYRYYETDISREVTLLSGVCRQVYLEAAVLPFKLNVIAFNSHNVMTNFLLLEQRLSRQQRYAITALLLRDNLPGANILTYLPNVQEVMLSTSQKFDAAKGRYRVVRKQGEEPRLQRASY